jgi:hypothetical protein
VKEIKIVIDNRKSASDSVPILQICQLAKILQGISNTLQKETGIPSRFKTEWEME